MRSSWFSNGIFVAIGGIYFSWFYAVLVARDLFTKIIKCKGYNKIIGIDGG